MAKMAIDHIVLRFGHLMPTSRPGRQLQGTGATEVALAPTKIVKALPDGKVFKMFKVFIVVIVPRNEHLGVFRGTGRAVAEWPGRRAHVVNGESIAHLFYGMPIDLAFMDATSPEFTV